MAATETSEMRERAGVDVTPTMRTMDRVDELLHADARFAGDVVGRPHALFVVAWRTLSAGSRAGERIAVVFTSAAVWDGARDLLQPFAHDLAEGTTLSPWAACSRVPA